MNLEQLETGNFDTVEAIQFLAKTLRGLVNPETAQALVQPAPLPPHAFFELLDDRVAKALLRADLDDVESVRKASDEELTAISGIGPATLRTLREVLG